MKLCVDCKHFTAPASEPVDVTDYGICNHPRSISINPVDGTTKQLRAYVSRNSVYHGCGLEASYFEAINPLNDDDEWLDNTFSRKAYTYVRV